MGAASHGKRGRQRCIFCQKDVFEAALDTPRGRANVSRCLKAFASFGDRTIFGAVLQRIGLSVPDWLQTLAAKAKEKKR